MLSTEAKQVKESVDNVSKALKLTSDSQSKLDKLTQWVATVNWEEQLNNLSGYTEDAVKVLNNYAGAKNELTDYQQYIKSSLEKLQKATEEGRLSARATDDKSRKEYYDLSQTYLREAAKDMTQAKELYGKLYKQAQANKDTKAIQALDKLGDQSGTLTGKTADLAKASVDNASKVTNLGAGIMMTQYLLTVIPSTRYC
jgi:hypothetical protein